MNLEISMLGFLLNVFICTHTKASGKIQLTDGKISKRKISNLEDVPTLFKASNQLYGPFAPKHIVPGAASLESRSKTIVYMKQSNRGSSNPFIGASALMSLDDNFQHLKGNFRSILINVNPNEIAPIETEHDPNLQLKDKKLDVGNREYTTLNHFNPVYFKFISKQKRINFSTSFVDSSVHKPNIFKRKLRSDSKRSIDPPTLSKQLMASRFIGGYPQSTAGSSLYGSYANAQSGQGFQEPLLGGGFGEPIEGGGFGEPIEGGGIEEPLEG